MKNDDAYANAAHIPGAEDFPPRWEETAQAYRETEATLGRARLNVAYGDHPRQKFDLFHPNGPARGLAVFIHGGYWLRFDRGYWSHFAEGLRARDWAVALPSYPLAPEVRIADITGSAAQAISHAAGMVSGPIVLTGHSAGGHLVARMATATSGLAPEVAGRIRAIAPISPVADLRPLLDTSMNDDFGMDLAAAEAESPALMDKVLDAPVFIHVGADERPAFLDQARWLAGAWPGSTLRIVPGTHHFDVIDALRDPDSRLVQDLSDIA